LVLCFFTPFSRSQNVHLDAMDLIYLHQHDTYNAHPSTRTRLSITPPLNIRATQLRLSGLRLRPLLLLVFQPPYRMYVHQRRALIYPIIIFRTRQLRAEIREKQVSKPKPGNRILHRMIHDFNPDKDLRIFYVHSSKIHNQGLN